MIDPSACALWNACWLPPFLLALLASWRHRRVERTTTIALSLLAWVVLYLYGLGLWVSECLSDWIHCIEWARSR